MSSISIKQITGGTAKIDSAAVEKFKKSIKGKLIQSGNGNYEQARQIWNGMIDRKPALIVQCDGAEDVRNAVRFAREHDLFTAVRGGGHNIAGSAICDDGIMIDLSQMKTVKIDAKNRVAHVGPGTLLGEFDKEAQAAGLATPLGINSTTGVAGLTLGGGFGWLTRKYGMTVDSFIGADVVTAEGEQLHASADENPDLFWGLTGGGGNFGIVTDFQFRLHPVGPELLSGLIVYPHSEAKSVLEKYREYISGLSDDTSVWVVLRKAPPLPFLPESVHGTDVVVFALFHAGDPEAGKKAIEPVRHFGTVLGEHVGVQPFVNWQAAFDPLLTPGARNYWKSHNFSGLSDQAIELIVKYSATIPSPQCEILFAHLGGAAGRIDSDATAYPHRQSDFVFNVHGRWDDAGDDEKCIGWAREFHGAMAPLSTGGVYMNFLTEDEMNRAPAAFGRGHKRLAEVKKKYDPDNFFRLNLNISPN